jgi:hypothetical protein
MFAATSNSSVALPVPLATGSVNHAALELALHGHAELESVIPTSSSPEDALRDALSADSIATQPLACVTTCVSLAPVELSVAVSVPDREMLVLAP